MTDWLGMTPRPEVPRPELRAAVLARSRGGRRRPQWAVSPLAAAAVLLVVVGAGWGGVSLRRLGGRVRWHGKPYPSVYESCLGLLGIGEKRRILAIGDSLRTDIAGAAGAGIDSLLIAGGIHAAEFGDGDAIDLDRVATAIAKSGSRPIGVMARFVW